MKPRWVTATALALSCAVPLQATAQVPVRWSISWESDWLDCDYWGKPMTASWAPCSIGNIQVSICTTPKSAYGPQPWAAGQPITIVGVDLTQEITDPAASGKILIGSGHTADGADVFALGAGIGTYQVHKEFPGTGIPQGEIPGKPGYAHIDVYGQCYGGNGTVPLKQRVSAIIYYTSP